MREALFGGASGTLFPDGWDTLPYFAKKNRYPQEKHELQIPKPRVHDSVRAIVIVPLKIDGIHIRHLLFS